MVEKTFQINAVTQPPFEGPGMMPEEMPAEKSFNKWFIAAGGILLLAVIAAVVIRRRRRRLSEELELDE
jgi:LPXTG-motif cell wall-anchored protein